MNDLMQIQERIFSMTTPQEFNDLALEIFRLQYRCNDIYQQFCNSLKIDPEKIDHPSKIPFLPIEFFKDHKIITGQKTPVFTFSSSGTTATKPGKHQVIDPEIYKQSFMDGFRLFYGPAEQYVILALLPSYLEREGSSLVYMVDELISRSGDSDSGFYLHELGTLKQKLNNLRKSEKKVMLIGVSFALLDLAEKYALSFPELIIMETGGMKGRRKELVREELHEILKKAFEVREVHSEYGMTELFSQAWSRGEGRFFTPPWMKILVRDTNDPLSLLPEGKTGGISVIDLANLHSCSFVATQDLGKIHPDGSFEVLGRFDQSDVRGCNLMVGN